MRAATVAAEPASEAYQQGSSDRDAWETWYNGLSGAERDGATFWTGQRSLRAPLPCSANPTFGDDWLTGCTEAKRRLTPIDVKRKSDPQYWNGWNKISALPALARTRDFEQNASVRTEPALPSTTHDTELILAQWSGSTMMTTRPFHTDGPWELQWTSSPGFFVIKLVKASDDKALIANQTDGESSSSFVPNGGTYYLQVEARGPWTIKAIGITTTDTKPADIPASRNPPATSIVRAPNQPAEAAQTNVRGPDMPTIESASGMPYEEEAAIQIVHAAVNQYRTGKNEMEQGAARPMRARALCRVMTAHRADNWIGTVAKLSTNGEGKGVLAIQIANDVFVKTWNNSLSDISDQTLIDPQSSLFSTASQLHEGQKVRFHGTFISSITDCLKESSITLDGSIAEPEFIIKFESVDAMK